MKVILSKKGLDSSFKSLCLLPIPIGHDKTTKIEFVPIPDKFDKLKYGNIESYIKSFTKVMKSDEAGKYKSFLKTHCHLDPQLENYFNCKNFKGSLGQIEGFQTHLENNSVKVGDLFLFYGSYCNLISENKITKQGKHVIWGYMQIGEIIKPETLNRSERKKLKKKYPWLKYQPHWNKKKYKDIKNNTIYIAKDICSFDNNLKGYGILDYTVSLNLTDRDNDNTNKTSWKVKELSGCKTSYKSLDDKKGFDELGQYKVPARCQELVINDEKAEKWAIDLIRRHTYQNKSITILNDSAKNIKSQINKLAKSFSKEQILNITCEQFCNDLMLCKGLTWEMVHEYIGYKLIIITDIQFLKNKLNEQDKFFQLLQKLLVEEREIVLSCDDNIDNILNNQNLIELIKKHSRQ